MSAKATTRKPVDKSKTYHVGKSVDKSCPAKSSRGGRGEVAPPRSTIHPSLSRKIQKGFTAEDEIELELLRLEEEDLLLAEQERVYVESHKIEYFEPFPHQARFVEYIRGGKKTALLVGANQVGKTVICANVAGSFSEGCVAPWDKGGLFPSDAARASGGRQVIGRILCFDHATEVLTNRGWMDRKNILETDMALTINPETRVSGWQKINCIVDEEGEVVHITGGEMDAVVTGDHRWLVRYQTTGHKYAWKIITTQDFNTSHAVPMSITPLESEENREVSDSYIKLLAWIFTEGTYRSSCNAIVIYQSVKANPGKCHDIESVMLDLYGKTSKYTVSSGMNQYTINSEIGGEIRKRFPLKKPDAEFIFGLSLRQRQLFYDTLIDGDGTRHKGRDVFYAKDKDFIDLFQILAVSLGYKTSIGFDGRPGRENYYIYSSYSGHMFSHAQSWNFKKGIRKIPVWCVSTDNGIIVARRGKNPFVTGNCNDWEKAARDTIVPKLKEWLPAGSYETKKNSVGVEHEFVFKKSGSRFTILTYKEDTKSHEGWTGDWVFADEPPPRDKYVANRRGLVARNGIFLMAMTAISEPWILDEIVLEPDVSTGIVADIPIEANTSLSEEAIRIFSTSLSEDEKVARLQGGWLQLTGRVWKMFDSGKHVVDDFEIPPDWPVEFQIDFHLNTPHAVSFCAVDPYNRYFVCEEIWENCGSEELADKIVKLRKLNSWRLKYGEIDALSKGDTSYIRNRFGVAEDSYTTIEKRLAKFQIRLGVGSKDEKSYIKAVETRLKGPNGMPTVFIFRSCTNTIKQVQRWAYDDKTNKPKDDGHFPECLGRFTQSGLKWRPMVHNIAPITSVSPLMMGLRQVTQMAR